VDFIIIIIIITSPTGCGRLVGIVRLRTKTTEFSLVIIIISSSSSSSSGVRLSPHGTAATTGLLYQPHMTDDSDCGAIDRMIIGRGTRSTRRKSAPAPPCPPSRARTRAVAVGNA
jgi:hypothetical protein